MAELGTFPRLERMSSEERLACLIDGVLSPRERLGLMEVLAQSGELREQLASAVHLLPQRDDVDD